MGNGMNRVLPGLYVGNYRDSKDSAQLDRFKITHILAIHDAAKKLHSDKHYLCVLASDTPDQNLSQYFSLCNDFIHAARLRGGNVLIHCLAGMSRSVTIAVAYIMSVTSLNWKEALKVVRVGRSVANPNVGFQKQLQDFEYFKLQEERRRLKERFPSLALVVTDEEQCRIMLVSYQGLLLTRSLCEGDCALGQICPTGLCRATSRSYRSSGGSRKSSLRTTPRKLPATPVGSHACLARSSSAVNHLGNLGSMTSLGGRSKRELGMGGFYGSGSAPASRAGSRLDVSDIDSSPVPSLYSSHPKPMGSLCGPSVSRINSAPATPRGSPTPWRRSTLASSTIVEKLDS
ncbi:unnamed protein product [Bemisia tabaci]|uniref:Dual specificity protein phosphatase 15 n=1 Tax=Bemisia tabaci TaxID=7038 RepID=A0A9P0EYI1_BEMTA|nr:PREDICTED: dual specificity protein phosphatase 15-like [Bemisia tabaci]CAH0381157.1 unnamed protein product [Bemisia tabaci]